MPMTIQEGMTQFNRLVAQESGKMEQLQAGFQAAQVLQQQVRALEDQVTKLGETPVTQQKIQDVPPPNLG